MNAYRFSFADTQLVALCSGALWWPSQALLCVSDLHLGKSERIARRGGTALPPYDTRDTLTRLSADLDRTNARTVICLGDSFDDPAAAQALDTEASDTILRLQAGRNWVWIEGNHDPGPLGLGGTHRAEWHCTDLVFRHIAKPVGQFEISGHYHPKVHIRARGRTITRTAFLTDSNRVIMPSYGTYTGGLSAGHPTLSTLMQPGAIALTTGAAVHAVAMPR